MSRIPHRIRTIAAGLFTVVAVSPAAGQTLGVLENPALADEASAIWVNPAGLGFHGSSSFLFSRSFEDTSTYTNVLFSRGRAGIGWLRNDASLVEDDHWRLAFGGGGEHEPFGIGFAVDWLHRDFAPSTGLRDGRKWVFDGGFLSRPAEWISLGGVVRDLGEAVGDRQYVAGLGFRPFGTDLTLAGRATWVGEDVFDEEPSWQAGAIVAIGPGIEIEGAYERDRRLPGASGRAERFFGGLRIVFGHGSISGAAYRSRGGDIGLGWAVMRGYGDLRATRLHRRGNVAEIKLAGVVRDQGSFSLFGGGAVPLSNVLAQIRRAANSPDIGALYLRFEGLSIGAGMADELRAALLEFREQTNRPIVAYLQGADNEEYYIASVADSVILEPMGTLDLIGYAAQPLFLRRALDKLGITPHFGRIGEYKSAVEMFTDSTISEPDREQLAALLDDWYARLVDGVAKSRGLTTDSVRTLIDRAPYTASDARLRGLVDKVDHEDRAFEAAKALAKARSGHGGGRVRIAGRRNWREEWGPTPRIAVVFASGTIIRGGGGVDLFSGERFVGSETLVKALERVRKDKSIRAVVLRVDSPGGDALASDLIWRELRRLSDAKKPFVVSVGDLAASGGYLIACGADSIFANPSSIVGSIGIFMGKLEIAGLFDKLGLDVDIVARGENAAIYSSQTGLTPAQRDILERGLRNGYDVFVGHVAEGREMTAAAVDSIGRGRIWSGEDGVDRGLIDKTGGLDAAVRSAMLMAGIEDRAELVPYPKQPSFWEQVFDNPVAGAARYWNSDGDAWFYDPVAAELR